jgi:hypothetical protein
LEIIPTRAEVAVQTKELPSQTELSALLRYEPKTGLLFWKKRTEDMFKDAGHSAAHTCSKWNSRFAGREALTKVNVGYRCGRLNYRYVLAHRVIWKLVTGEDAVEVDHIDGDRSNNRWSNLRSVTSSGNRRNSAKRSDNTTGVVGVVWNSARGKWMAGTHLHSGYQYLGLFDSFDDAVAARKAAERENDFHPNHGREAT